VLLSYALYFFHTEFYWNKKNHDGAMSLHPGEHCCMALRTAGSRLITWVCAIVHESWDGMISSPGQQC